MANLGGAYPVALSAGRRIISAKARVQATAPRLHSVTLADAALDRRNLTTAPIASYSSAVSSMAVRNRLRLRPGNVLRNASVKSPIANNSGLGSGRSSADSLALGIRTNSTQSPDWRKVNATTATRVNAANGRKINFSGRWTYCYRDARTRGINFHSSDEYAAHATFIEPHSRSHASSSPQRGVRAAADQPRLAVATLPRDASPSKHRGVCNRRAGSMLVRRLLLSGGGRHG